MTTDPSSLRVDARRNYDHLLEVASAVFSSRGTFVPLDAIAKQAGVGIGTLYRHFPSRKALLEGVYADKVAELVAKAHTLLNTNSPDKALKSWLEDTIKFAAEQDGFSDLMRLSVSDEKSPLLAAGTELLTRAQKAGMLRSDITIYEVLQLVNGVVMSETSTADITRAKKLLTVIMTGLKTSV